MRKVIVGWTAAALLAALALGCASPTGKGANKDKDRPTPPARQGN